MYIFGGVDATTGQTLNDFWVFDFDTHLWSEVKYQGCWPPKARAGATLVTWPVTGSMFLFGGSDVTADGQSEFFNDIWMYTPHNHDDTKRIEWEGESPRWIHVTPSGPQPAARGFFGAGVIGMDFLTIYGGVTYGDHFGINHVYERRERDFVGDRLLNYLDDAWIIALSDIYISVYAYPYNQDIKYYGPSAHPEWTKLENQADEPSAPARAVFPFVYDDWSGSFTAFGGKDAGRETRADVWTFYADGVPPTFNLNWSQRACYPGYEFPWCTLNCRYANYCSGHGVCLEDGSCKCEQGWQGATCDFNICDGYRGFSAEEMNYILLPKSIESIYIKLDTILNKLAYIRELLPSSDNDVIAVRDLAVKSHDFYRNCLVNDLCETTDGFEGVIGCNIPCGSETYCIINDTCINGVCDGGKPRDCSEEYGNNKCVNSWCDEELGCMHSTVTCVYDPHNHPCTTVECDPQRGCVYTPIDCNDHDCCTLDYCDAEKQECVHIDKCDDGNPCTSERCNKECDFGTCQYEAEFCCFPSLGQNVENPALWEGEPPRCIGEPITFTGSKMVPEVCTDNTAEGFFWLKGCGKCELIYKIYLDAVEYSFEDGTHIYAAATATEVAGVVGTLPLGSVKGKKILIV